MEFKVSTTQLGLTFAGCFLGAGYVSGKELWRFFGQYGTWGWLGLLASLLGLGFFGVLVLRLALHTEKINLSELIIPWEVPVLRSAVSVFSTMLLFCVVVIMTAGVGAAFNQLFHLPAWLCSMAFSLLVAILALAGLSGMLSLFSFVVPTLILATTVFSTIALIYLPQNPPLDYTDHGWFSSAVIFCGYNVFSSIAILAPLSRAVPPSHRSRGIFLGCGLLFVIAVPILLALRHCGSQAQAELPMLAIASRIWGGFGWIYAGLLLMAMLTTALSCFLTGINGLMAARPFLAPHKTVCLFLAVSCTWLASLLGFGNLINLVYPLFGIISFLCLACLVLHDRRKARSQSSMESV